MHVFGYLTEDLAEMQSTLPTFYYYQMAEA